MTQLRYAVCRFPLSSYFALAFAASGAALLLLGLPRLSAGGTPNTISLAVFPGLVVALGLAGLTLTAVTGGNQSLSELWSRMRRWRVPAWYYAALLIPPLGILLTLTALQHAFSPAFTPGFFLLGITFGVLAGFFEETGWTGFAYPRLSARFGSVRGALLLGLMWGGWHLPVVDSLGVASPHGAAWQAFFASFILLAMAVRMVICWLYTRTGSVLLAQLMHASSTGFLVVLSAPQVTAGQEAIWYATYGALLWCCILVLYLVRKAAPTSFVSNSEGARAGI